MTTFKQIEALVAVVETGSFERAAARLGIVQSAVSRHIKEFEETFDYPLFDRSGRSVQLTLEGGAVFARAQAVLRQRDAVVKGFLNTEIAHRSLRLGVTELYALTRLPEFVSAIREAYPALDLQLDVGHSITLYEKLRVSELDIVVVPDLFGATNLTKRLLSKVQHVWCCSPSVDIPKTRIRVPDLIRYPLLIPGAPSGTGAMIVEWLRDQGLDVSTRFSSGSLVALAGMAVSGQGVAFLPTAVTEPLQFNGLLREVGVSPSIPPLRYVAVARTETLTPFFDAILDLAEQTWADAAR
ncbi:LysR family transcriptional regulator [Pandoraea anhela]|uniref:LysR family transcriptional regulator n=1 Tax=Pandoraea anhela TaxID=2508295 RepID=A0A5E4WBX2_9BURK|nr:LysR family transcriptional regulator [Pandoraea anhela]VVE21154.1 LysR family transcriptional regulator [Pandoraea anhela]